jgi:3'(2'), 5'-bisphosphate nucleotidase
LKEKSKGYRDPVTVADITAQKTIESTLQAIYPTLVIQGEESQESMATVESAVTPDQVTEEIKAFISQSKMNEHHEKRLPVIKDHFRKLYSHDEISSDVFDSFFTSEAVVWIDPLDGTQDFVNGNLSAVTVLIGLAINGKSRIGIVHKPFSDEDMSKGKTVFGTGEHGAFVLPYDEKMTQEELLKRKASYMEPFDQVNEVADDYTIKVGTSLNHLSAQMKDTISKVSPVEIVRLGGAGNKSLAMAFAKTDSYLYPGKGLAYWDICAPESVVKGMGALTTNGNFEKLTYPITGNRVISGLIMARSPPMYNQILRRLRQIKL